MNLYNLSRIFYLIILSFSCEILYAQTNNAGQPPCNCTINAGPDKQVCQPGGTVQLNAVSTGSVVSFEWLPTPGLDDYFILNPEATVNATTNYTISQRCHTNKFIPIPNFNFSAGNTGFTNDYVYQPTAGGPFGPGNYTVTNNPNLFNPAFPACGDHTSGSGMMLLVDGSVTLGINFWCQNMTLQANTDYVFEFWVALAFDGVPPQIQVTCNGIVVGLVDVAQDPTCQWNKYTVYFNPGVLTTVDMCMQEMTGVGFGNDFVVDDIVLEEICRVEDYMTVYVNPTKATTIYKSICEGQSYTLGNQTFSTSGSYDITLKTWKSCDSVVTLNLDVISIEAEIEPPHLLSCKSNIVTLDGSNSSFGSEYSYLWTTTNGKIETNPNNFEVDVSKPGTYTLLVTYSLNGVICKKSASVEVYSDYTLPNINAGKDTLLTCKDTLLTLHGTVQNPINNFSVGWSTDNGKILSKTDTINPQIGASGNYIFTVTNNLNGCKSTDTLLVSQDASLPKSIIKGNSILNCLTDTIILDGNNSDKGYPFTYTWSTSNGTFIGKTDTLKVNVNSPGDYFLTIQDTLLGCKSVSSFSIVQDINIPQIDAGETDTLGCITTLIKLMGLSNLPDSLINISWTSKIGSINSGANTLTPTINKPGVYYLEIENKINGCINTDSVLIINDANLPVAFTGPDDTLTCNKTIVDIKSLGNNPNSSINIKWQTIGGNIIGSDSVSTIQVDKPGLYILNLINTISGCQSTDSITIISDKVLPVLNISIPDTLNCILNKTILDASTSSNGPNYSYSWNSINGNIIGNSTTAITTADKPGTYFLRIINTKNGCLSFDSILVIQDIQVPDISLNGPLNLSCQNPTGKVVTINNSGNIPLQYLWSSFNGQINGSVTNSSIDISKGGKYFLTTTNLNNGCTSEDSITVNFLGELPIVNAGLDTVFNCCNSIIYLNGTYQYSGNVNINWVAISGLLGGGVNTLKPEIFSGGKYLLIVTDPITGCSAKDTVIVNTDLAAPSAEIIDPGEITCDQLEKTLSLNNYASNWIFEWSTGNGNIIDPIDSDSVKIDKAGNYYVKITKPSNCCSYTASLLIDENKKLPVIDAGNDLQFGCSDSLLTMLGSVLSPKVNIDLMWYGNNGQIIKKSNTIHPEVNESGTYYFTVKDLANGCISIDSVVINSTFSGNLDIVSDIYFPGCGNKAVININSVAGGQAPYLYSLNGSPFQPISQFNNLQVGNYSLEIMDSNGCLFKKDLEVPDNIAGSLDLSSDITINVGDSIQLIPELINFTLQDIDSIYWSPETDLSCVSCLNPYAHPLNNQIYTLYLIDKSGCNHKAAVRLFVNKIYNIYVPNVFSPNGDGINDFWKIYVDESKVKSINRIAVYDRWGESIWSDSAINDLNNYKGWDGKYRGRNLNPSVFVYYAEIEFMDGTTHLYKGDITLNR